MPLIRSACFLMIVAALACNNAPSAKDNPITDGNKSVSANPVSGGCDRLILFKKGAVIESKNYNAAGAEVSSQSTTITDVRTEAGITIAEADISVQPVSGTPTMRHLQYKCDGNSLYMDMSGLLSSLSSMKIISASEKGLQFPVQLKEGQELPESSLSVEMARSTMNIKTTVTYKNRKVEGREKITTAGGSWDCYKLSSDIVTETEMKGNDEHQQKIAEMMKKNSPVQKNIIWFSPETGLVRMEQYSGETLLYRTDITSIKSN